MRHAASLVPACLAALLLSGAVVAAQDAKGAGDTKVKSDNGKVVTMTGCVEIGGGTSFVLTNITSEPGGPYSLVARKGLDLGPYIQQKVALTGVVVPAATSRDRDDKIKIKEPTASSSTTVKVARTKDAQFLVASVKALAPTCHP
jgi:hypothetical protein